MLARAFLDDPVTTWSCRPDALRPAMLERFHVTRLRQMLLDHEVWTTSDLKCAALWAPPKRWKTTPRQDAAMAACLLHPRLIVRLPTVAAGLLGIERRHPTHPPHFYLAVLGTDPSAQGQGLASAALRPVLDQCDADGIAAYPESSSEDTPKMRGGTPAYLECSKESNIGFYERVGFKVIGELRLPRGPKLWPMWRNRPQRRERGAT
jgi:GNAT superfamily N-acetyltransferase